MRDPRIPWMTRRQLLRAGLGTVGGAAAAGLLAACGGTAAPAAGSASAGAGASASGSTSAAASSSSAAAASTTPKPGGVLKVALEADIIAPLDPHHYNAYSTGLAMEQVYSGLVRLDPQLNVTPDLATDWTVSPDGKTYTFKIRPGVTFHDGTPLTADDVKFSFDRIRDKATGSSQAYLLVDVTNTAVQGGDTFVMTLDKPFSPLLQELSTMYIVSQAYVQKNGAAYLTNHMNGTGPFMFKDFVPNTHTELVKNPNYYSKGLPYLDGITFIPAPDDPSRTADIQTGNVDFADQIAQKDIITLQSAKGVVLDGGVSTLHDYLFFNEKRKPFDNPLVRQAIAYALDRDAMTKLVLFGYGQPIYGGCIAPFNWAYDADLQPFKTQDMAKAKALLAQAGLSGGFSTTLGASTAYQPQVDAAQLIKQYLAPLGINVQVVAEEWGTYIDRLVNKHDYNMAIIGWIGALDPDDYLYSRFHSNQPNNFEFYSNPQVDQLLDQGRTLQDHAQRLPIYHQIESTLATDSPMAWFYWYKQYEGVRDYVKGYTHMANASKVTFLNTWLDK